MSSLLIKSFHSDGSTYRPLCLYEEILSTPKVTISFLEEKPLSVELPTNIECEIENTEGVVKKQTASSSYKPAKLKNGLDIMVPPFIEEGNKIILDTRTLEYIKKIN